MCMYSRVQELSLSAQNLYVHHDVDWLVHLVLCFVVYGELQYLKVVRNSTKAEQFEILALLESTFCAGMRWSSKDEETCAYNQNVN